MKVRHKWYSEYRRERDARHTLILGDSDSGKTYLGSWLMEREIDGGTGKVFILKCTKSVNLSESLGFMFPNSLNKKAYRQYMYGGSLLKNDIFPKAYRMVVYKPVSAYAGNKYPANFRPFTVNLKDIDEESFKIMSGTKEYQRIWSEFQSIVSRIGKRYSVADFKRILNKRRSFSGDYFQFQKNEMGYKEVVFSSESVSQTISSLESRFSSIRKYGFFSSRDNPFDLRKQLREEILKKDRIALLDTSDIKDWSARLFLIIYFMQLIANIMQEEKAMFKTSYRLKLFFNDIRDLFPANEKKSEMEVIATEVVTNILATYRHGKMDLVADVQSPAFLGKGARKNWIYVYVTKFTADEDIKWLAGGLNQRNLYVRDVMSVLEWLARKGKYRFIDLNNPENAIPLSKDGKDRGYEVPFPRRSMHGKVDTSSWKKLGLPIITLMGQAKSITRRINQEGEEKLFSSLKKEKESKQLDTISKEDMDRFRGIAELWRKFGAIKTIQKHYWAIANKNPDVPDWKRGISTDKVERMLRDAEIWGFITADEIAIHKKKLIKTPENGSNEAENASETPENGT